MTALAVIEDERSWSSQMAAVWTTILEPYSGKRFLRVIDGSECVELLFEGRDSNLLCLYEDHTYSHGFVDLAVFRGYENPNGPVYVDTGRIGSKAPRGAKRIAISAKLRFNILERDDFRCQYCGAGPNDESLHVDHVVPVAAGGPTTLDNLVTACASCNLGKGARVL